MPYRERISSYQSRQQRPPDHDVSVSAGEPDLTVARQVLGGTSDEQILALPGVLTGSAEQVAATLLRYRGKYGLTYIGVLETSMTAFAKVIERLRSA
jgi:hypothetical protein